MRESKGMRKHLRRRNMYIRWLTEGCTRERRKKAMQFFSLRGENLPMEVQAALNRQAEERAAAKNILSKEERDRRAHAEYLNKKEREERAALSPYQLWLKKFGRQMSNR
ncbi:MAG: hypothetical protein ABIE68_02000 [bacterium]